jgi:NADH-quinone oxidoreductase subunit K
MSLYLILSSILFVIGSFGMFLIRKHIIIILISFELIILAINCNFVIGAIFLDDLMGQIYGLLILTVAAGESALGLALIIVYYRLIGGISINLISLLKS